MTIIECIEKTLEVKGYTDIESEDDSEYSCQWTAFNCKKDGIGWGVQLCDLLHTDLSNPLTFTLMDEDDDEVEVTVDFKQFLG